MSQGSYLRDCTVEHSVIGVRSRIESGVTIKASHGLARGGGGWGVTVGMGAMACLLNS